VYIVDVGIQYQVKNDAEVNSSPELLNQIIDAIDLVSGLRCFCDRFYKGSPLVRHDAGKGSLCLSEEGIAGR
jgi:hypothetical protein